MRLWLVLLMGSMALSGIPTLAVAQEAAGMSAAPPKMEKEDEQLINELFVGEKIYLQDKGEFVLVFTPSFARSRDSKETEMSIEVKYGLTDRLQLSAEAPFDIVNPNEGSQHSGLGDASFAINYNFIQKENFAAGVRSEFRFPTGDENRDLGAGEFVWAPDLLTSTRIGKGEVYLGIGGEIGENHDAFTYSATGAYPWKQLVGVLELTGATGGGEDTLYLAPGVVWHPRDKIELEFGVPIGLTHDSGDYRLVAKIIFEF